VATRGLVLGLVEFALLSLLPPSALAQGASDGIDLTGMWKMDGVYVLIGHSGRTVKTDTIYTGAKCLNETDRTYIIQGELSSTTTPAGIQSTLSGKLWVCSGSPDLVQRCGGRFSAYETTFSNARVEPNRISGDRLVQWVSDCQPTGFKETRSFELTRNACTMDEGLVAYQEEWLRQRQREATANLDVFTAAHSAARARWGDTYTYQNRAWPTNTLLNPYALLTGNFSVSEASGNQATPEVFNERLRLVVHSGGSRDAFSVARMMMRDALPEAAAMVNEASRLEEIFERFQSGLNTLQTFRQRLDACRKANPAGRADSNSTTGDFFMNPRACNGA
jgi:hypothetical protein